MPAAFGAVLVKQTRGDVVVSVAEDGRGHFDGIAKDALGGIPAGIHDRLNLLDNDPAATFGWLHALTAFGTDDLELLAPRRHSIHEKLASKEGMSRASTLHRFVPVVQGC